MILFWTILVNLWIHKDSITIILTGGKGVMPSELKSF